LGGLSGRALWPQTVQIVAAVRSVTGNELPVSACGGIATPDDVVECLEAGAATVQIYTAMIFDGPGVIGSLVNGLASRLRERGVSLADLVGTASGG
jgi:dihydroorotate dehydrogenase